ncbi:hypothetical protein HDU97_006770 [Phlyctochytrium planicorne]|nr:hypothetical protein HDU97_006770 [Phlyctochytrium planicorne]
MKTSLLLTASAFIGIASAAPLIPRQNAINWSPCTDTRYPLLCATINVPLNHLDKNDQRTIPIAISKYSASKPSKGVVVVNPGGPGGRGRNLAFEIGTLFDQLLDSSYDVVGFDPRGTNSSIPMQCFENPGISAYFNGQEFMGVVGKPGGATKETFAAYAEVGAKGCQKFSAFNGEWGKYLSGATTARDMDKIREALGQDVLNFFAYSYGSYLAMTYANLFPDRVGRFAIDGIVEATSWTKGPLDSARDEYADTNEVFEAFAHECAIAGPSVCPLAILPSKVQVDGNFDGERGPGKKLAASLRKAIEGFTPQASINAPLPGVVTSDQIIDFVFNGLYSPEFWPDIYNLLANLLIQGSPDIFRAEYINQTPPSPRICPSKEPSQFRYVFLNGRCNDGEDLTNLSIDEISDRASRPDRTSWLALRPAVRIGLFCKHVPRPIERYTGPWTPPKLKNKILILSATLDPITPLSSAKKLHASLKPQDNSYLLIQKSYGHTTSAQPSMCTLRALASYFSTGTIPDTDKNGIANCASVTSPFPNAANVTRRADADEQQLKKARVLAANLAKLAWETAY